MNFVELDQFRLCFFLQTKTRVLHVLASTTAHVHASPRQGLAITSAHVSTATVETTAKVRVTNFVALFCFLRLAAPTWLLGRCGRHNSPPASSVMDFIFCCPDSSHVSVDAVHPSASVFLFFSKVVPHPVFVFRHILGLVSLHVQNTSVSLSCTSL